MTLPFWVSGSKATFHKPLACILSAQHTADTFSLDLRKYVLLFLTTFVIYNYLIFYCRNNSLSTPTGNSSAMLSLIERLLGNNRLVEQNHFTLLVIFYLIKSIVGSIHVIPQLVGFAWY